MFVISGFAVSAALYLLGAFSLLTALLVIGKTMQLWRGAALGRRFLQAFRAAGNLRLAAQLPRDSSPFGRVAAVGLGILHHRRAAERGLLEHHLRQEVRRERYRFDSGLALLASIRNGAPFVGLLGTVWGIVAALQGAGAMGDATFAAIAAPVGAALAVTGVGLVLAIPAALAFQVFTRRVQRLHADLDDFVHEFLARANSNAPDVAERRRDIARTRPFLVAAARNAS